MGEPRTLDETRALIGANLRRVRKARGLSQEKAGELVGLSRSTMGYYEQGRRNPSLQSLHKMAVAYDVDLSEFFRFERFVPAYLDDEDPEEEPEKDQ